MVEHYRHLIIFLLGIEFMFFLYYFILAVFIYRIAGRHLYFSLSTFGAFVYLVMQLAGTYTLTDADALLCHRIKLIGLFIVTNFLFLCAYAIFFPKSRVPYLILALSIAVNVLIATPYFIDLPIRRISVDAGFFTFRYSLAETRMGYSINAALLMAAFIYSFFAVLLTPLPFRRKLFGVFMFAPIAGGMNDFAVMHGLYSAPMMTEFVFVICTLGLFIIFLFEQRDEHLRTVDMNRMLEEKVDQRTRELALAKERAERTSRFKTKFLGSISHELRTPLNTIIGIADLFRFGSYDKTDEKLLALKALCDHTATLYGTQSDEHKRAFFLYRHLDRGEDLGTAFIDRMIIDRTVLGQEDAFIEALRSRLDGIIREEKSGLSKAVGYIHRAGDYLLTLINSLMDISAIESGRMHLARKRIPVEGLLSFISDYAESYMSAKGKKHLVFSVVRSKDMPDVIMSDEQRLRQVLINLISNAVKSTLQGSIRLSVERDKDAIRFSVSDTGVGIREEDKTNIFSEFSRTDTAVDTEGSGLGLSITRHIVEAMQGTLWFESTVGSGSTFYARIPIVQ